MKYPRRKSTRGRPPACQLCDWHRVERHPGGHMPRAVAKVAGLIICAKHLQILVEIAAAAGVRIAQDDVREVA